MQKRRCRAGHCDSIERSYDRATGTALFAVASLACAVADLQPLLLGARALQGLGGATISPAGLAIIASHFAEGGERNRALGVWGGVLVGRRLVPRGAPSEGAASTSSARSWSPPG